MQSEVAVGLPRAVERIEHLVTGAVLDPPVRGVGAKSRTGTATDLETGLFLPYCLEATNVGQRWSVFTSVAHEGAKHTSGVHAGELGSVADEDYFGLGIESGRHQLV